MFSGVQGLNILAGIVRSKCAAILIGPEGVGIMALFVQTIMTLTYFTQMGLRQSAVRDLTIASKEDSPERGRVLAAVCRRLAFWLGVFGMCLTLVLAPELSLWTFGTEEYAWGFRILSVTLLAAPYTSADNAILQSFGHLRRLARINVEASIVGTCVLVAAIYFWRMDGIVAALLAIPLAAWFFARAGSRGIPGKPERMPDARACWTEGRGMLVLGIYLTVTEVVTQLSSYLFSIYLNREGGTADVGIYQSGFTVLNYYVGVIFTAISIEYYPRLTSQIGSATRARTLVSHEIAVSLWILMPVAVLFVCFDHLMVWLLYSEEFMAMIPYIGIAIAGVVFRAVSWCMAFVMLARADGKAYVLTELASAALMLTLYVAGWRVLGFMGLGLAYIAWYAFYALIVYGVYRLRYRLRLGRGMGLLILFASAVCICASVVKIYAGAMWTALIFLPWLIPLSLRKLFFRK